MMNSDLAQGDATFHFQFQLTASDAKRSKQAVAASLIVRMVQCLHGVIPNPENVALKMDRLVPEFFEAPPSRGGSTYPGLNVGFLGEDCPECDDTGEFLEPPSVGVAVSGKLDGCYDLLLETLQRGRGESVSFGFELDRRLGDELRTFLQAHPISIGMLQVDGSIELTLEATLAFDGSLPCELERLGVKTSVLPSCAEIAKLLAPASANGSAKSA